MSVLTIAGEGGSSGKTTTAVTLAALLAGEGRQVLVIDLDLQANATSWLGVQVGEQDATAGDVLLRSSTLDQALLPTNTDGVRALAASRALSGDTVQLLRERGPEQRLKLAFRDLPADVEDVIIDCPGTVSVLTVAALLVADTVLTTASPGLKEINGVAALAETIAETADIFASDVTLDAVVPCAVPPSGAGLMYAQALQVLQDSYPAQVTPTVRRSVRVPEAASHCTPLPAWAPRDAVTGDYRDVLTHLRGRGLL